MIPMAIIGSLIIVALLLFYRQLLVCTFDPALALSLGIPATFVHYAMMSALSLTVVASFESVGAILAVALLILPGATARLWTDRMPAMLLMAAAHGVASTVLGYWLSHPSIMHTSAGGAISVAGFALFLGSWLFAPRHGLVTQWRTRRRLRRTIAVENLIKAIDDARAPAGLSAAELEAELRVPAKQLERALADAASWKYVLREGKCVRLTETGRARATRLRQAHELWEQFLQQKVGLAADHVHDAAEWIEHHLDEQRVESLHQTLKS
jgi:Mn-dependent DtxR family transcriptional regulator